MSKPQMTMKPYPLGIDNPIVVRGVIGTSRWAIYDRETYTKIAEFPTQFQAYESRRAILKTQGFDA